MKYLLLFFFIPLLSYGSDLKVVTARNYELIADHLLTTPEARINPDAIKDGDIIYLEPNFRHHFIEAAPHIRSSYILVTADSDIPAPGDYGHHFLDHPQLIAWFSINIENSHHPKLHLMPLGSSQLTAKKEITDRIYAKKNEFEKKYLLYSNFTIRNYVQERQPLYDLFSTKSFCYSPPFKAFEEYLIELASSKFVLSPRGNGLDCFRTWEALYFGAIPIVRTSSLDPVFADLPVLIVNNWDEITEEFLVQKYAEMQLRSYKWEKLDPNYWIQQIKNLSEAIKFSQ